MPPDRFGGKGAGISATKGYHLVKMETVNTWRRTIVKKTVFISSTYEDLKQQRAKLWETLVQYDVDIRGMEQFGARKSAPLDTCLAEVEQSDIYIGIIALRLGSIDVKSGKSFTQLEYEKAVMLDRDILIYFFDENNGQIIPKFIDFGEKHEMLEAFKSTLKERHTIDTFIDDDDLSEKLKRKFNELLTKQQENGSIVDEYSNSKDIIKKACLLPKVYSGKEIKLKIILKGQPFPASKSICESFNLEYGKTIGVELKIIEPKLDEAVFEHIFISYKQAEEFLSLEHGQEIEVYTMILFSENNIEKVKANFITQITQGAFSIGLAKSVERMFNYQTIPAEGKISLLLIDFVKKESTDFPH